MSIMVFTESETTGLNQAVALATENTSGEIRIHITDISSDDPVVDARRVFEDLGMRKNPANNGILFYISAKDRKFVLFGDDGINVRVAADFWTKTTGLVLYKFSRGEYVKGLMTGIELAGRQLARFFPAQRRENNVKRDVVSYGFFKE